MSQFTRKSHFNVRTNIIKNILDNNENVNMLSKKDLSELSNQINQIKENKIKSILLEKKSIQSLMKNKNKHNDESVDKQITVINNTLDKKNVSKYEKMVSILYLTIKNIYINIENYAVKPSSTLVVPTINATIKFIKIMFYCIGVLLQTTFGQLILVSILISIYRTTPGFWIINNFIQLIFGVDVNTKYANFIDSFNGITNALGTHIKHANATVSELTHDVANLLIQINNMKTNMVHITGNITNKIENATDIITASVLAGLSSSGIENLKEQLAILLSKDVSLNIDSLNQIQTMLSHFKLDNVKLDNNQYLELMGKQSDIMENIQLISNKLQNAPELMEQLIISLNEPNQGFDNINRLELVIQALGNINKVVSFETIFKLVNSANPMMKQLKYGGRYYKTKKLKNNKTGKI